MPNAKNSYPKRAYRRRQRERLAKRRIARAKHIYGTGYDYREDDEGNVYVIEQSSRRQLKKQYKSHARRQERRMQYRTYGSPGGYRKSTKLWWNIY